MKSAEHGHADGMAKVQSETRGDEAAIPPYPGQDRPGDPAAEAMGGDTSVEDVALPSEMAGHDGATVADGSAAGAGLARVPRRIERIEALDTVAGILDRVVPSGAREGRGREVLSGRWLGHALHPVVTDLPLGFWTSATALDLFGGPRAKPAARWLIGAGILASLPAVVTGASDWTQVERGPRRVGVAHAASNATALVLYTASYLARRRDLGRGTFLTLAGGIAATVGGFLGGDLTLDRAVTRDNRLLATR